MKFIIRLFLIFFSGLSIYKAFGRTTNEDGSLISELLEIWEGCSRYRTQRNGVII